MIFLSVFVIFVLTILLYLNWNFSYWKRRGVKVLKNTNYIFGNVTDVIFQKVPVYSTYKEIYEKCVANGEKFMGYYYLVRPGLVIADPGLVNCILKTDFNYFTDRPFYLNTKVDPLSEHLVSARGEKWKRMRDQLSPAFTPSKLKMMFQTLLQVGDQLAKVMDAAVDNRQSLNLKDISSKFIMDSIGATIFGIDCNTLNNQNLEFRHCTSQILGGSTSQNIKLGVSLLNPTILHVFGIPLNTKEASDFCLKITKSTIESREKNNIIRKDLMHLLIQLRNNVNIEKDNDFEQLKVSDDGKKALDVQEIASQALIFFGAAYETSSQTISFLVSNVLLNKEIELKLRNEIFSVLAKHGGKVTFDAIMDMPYLDMCIKETLRKYPGAAVVARVCTRNYKIPETDVVVEKGTSIYIPVMELHYDSRYYPDPEKFDPERFSPDAENNQSVYLPMGGGPRICIGGRLGTIKIKLFMVLLFSNYKFSISPRTKLPLTLNKTAIILTLNEEIYLNMEKL